MSETDWAAIFREEFRLPPSAIEAEIMRVVLGDEFLEGLGTYGFLTRTELQRFVEEVKVSPGCTLVDLGCGRGGPGLWVATQTEARLIGIDIADTAIECARARAAAVGLEGRADFRVGTFEETSLSDGVADAVMSADAFLFAPDKPRALREIARVLRPGGRFVFTSWDYDRQPAGRPPQVDDHRPLLSAAGFRVIAYEETAHWRDRQTRYGEMLLAAVPEIAAESGADREKVRDDILEMNATIEAMSRRFLAVAERA